MAFTQDVAPTVRSEPLTNGKPVVRKAPSGSMLPLGIVLFVFGALGWIAGGKYTVEGWVVALNMFGRWVGVTQQLTTPRGWWLVGAIVASGLVYSKVELMVWKRAVYRSVAFWIGWGLIFLSDLGSTVIGVVNPAPDAALVFHQLAALAPLAIIWSVVLTVAPEYLILEGYKLFRR